MAKKSKAVFHARKDTKDSYSVATNGDELIRAGLTKAQAKNMAKELNQEALRKEPYPPATETQHWFRATIKMEVDYFWTDAESASDETAEWKDRARDMIDDATDGSQKIRKLKVKVENIGKKEVKFKE